MRNSFLIIFAISCFYILTTTLANNQCLEDQNTLLLKLKENLVFNSSHSKKLVEWNDQENRDCCVWDGVECDDSGHVISLELDDESISGGLENSTSLFGLKYLEKLNLASNRFNNINIPREVIYLTNLVYLNLSNAGFAGQIPLFKSFKKLVYVDLYNNSFSGRLLASHFGSLSQLVYISLGHNMLSGSIPLSLFALPVLKTLVLSNNQFDGQIGEVAGPLASQLITLDLSFNHLKGPVPKFFFQLKHLDALLLSSNIFNSTLELEMFTNLPKLTTLEISHNNLSIDASNRFLKSSPFPKIVSLKLASCKLQSFPDFLRQSNLSFLDLSANQITGEIPNWIWQIGNGTLTQLNLSCNHLTGLEEPYSFPSLSVLDLHSNKLRGKLPTPPVFSACVDFSNNRFSGSIPSYIGDFITGTSFFSVANNTLTGEIPKSICNSRSLQVLDLSNNGLIGTIPSCLFNDINNLRVLNLGRNKLSGIIPDTLPLYCSIKTIDLSRNALEGKLSRSLLNCSSLEVLNVGSNKVEDEFPCMLKSLTSLRVLVLRSNRFHGDIQCSDSSQGWQNLQIIDISSNNFSGELSHSYFSNWKAMMIDENNEHHLGHNHLRYDYLKLNDFYYQDMITVIIKGLEMELVKILMAFKSVDFSSNNFHGEIPPSVGDLGSLYALNFSHNSFGGEIPASIGELTQLGSLDLSGNHLTGKIPEELASLTLLSSFNVSFNQLFGSIPQGNQFQTFSTASYEGNAGLCGFPLNKSCNVNKADEMSRTRSDGSQRKIEIDTFYMSAPLGFIFGLGIVFCPRLRKRYFNHVDRYLLSILTRSKKEEDMQ